MIWSGCGRCTRAAPHRVWRAPAFSLRVAELALFPNDEFNPTRTHNWCKESWGRLGSAFFKRILAFGAAPELKLAVADRGY